MLDELPLISLSLLKTECSQLTFRTACESKLNSTFAAYCAVLDIIRDILVTGISTIVVETRGFDCWFDKSRIRSAPAQHSD